VPLNIHACSDLLYRLCWQNGAVHGLQSLRVVDASLLPLTVRGNIHLTVLMLAEKLSDAIKAEYVGASAAVVETEQSVPRGRL